MGDFHEILQASEAGDPHAAAQLLPLVYEELRALAARRLAHEKAGQSLDATALVHEAYLRLVGSASDRAPPEFANRGHFFAAAAEAMRRILVERARERKSLKRGGGRQRADLEGLGDAELPASHDRGDELLAVHEALGMLESHDGVAAGLVKLRYFAGLGHQEAAAALVISRRQADRLWAIARAWLFQQIQ